MSYLGVGLTKQLGVGFLVVYHHYSKNDWGECPSVNVEHRQNETVGRGLLAWELFAHRRRLVIMSKVLGLWLRWIEQAPPKR